jgi:hypothetical protein
MGHMQINDIGMEPIGDHLRGVRVLRLGYCVQISDEGLTHLAGESHQSFINFCFRRAESSLGAQTHATSCGELGMWQVDSPCLL